MANLTIGLDGPTLDISVMRQIADADSPRLMAWLMSPQSGFGTVTENVQSEVPGASWSPGEGETEDDRPTITTQAWVTRQATPEEAATNYADYVLANLLSSTVAWEKAQAAQAAADAITPIAPI